MSNKECKKYKELIMESIDGEINNNDKIYLDTHLQSCEDCKIYFRKMERIKKATNSLIYDIPPFMEEKIMSKIMEEHKRPIFVFDFSRAFAYAASFSLILFISIFLIYNRFDNKTIKLSDIPTISEIQISKQAKSNESLQKRYKSVEIKSEIAQDINKQNKQKNINSQMQVVLEKEQKIALNSKDIINEKTQIKPVQDYNVKKIDTIQPGLAVAKVTPIPPIPYNPLLTQDKAIVANNVINPLQGDKAIIRFMVDDTVFVKIVIYDKNVRPVSIILNEEKGRGTYEATWAGKSDNNEIVSEGVYFVYIQIGTRVIKKSIIVNK